MKTFLYEHRLTEEKTSFDFALGLRTCRETLTPRADAITLCDFASPSNMELKDKADTNRGQGLTWTRSKRLGFASADIRPSTRAGSS